MWQLEVWLSERGQQDEVMDKESVGKSGGETTLFGEYWNSDYEAGITLAIKVTNKTQAVFQPEIHWPLRPLS